MNRLRAALRNWLRGPSVDQDTEAELRSYLDFAADEHVRRGMRPEEAKRAARLEMGGVEQTSERVRDARAGRLVEAIWRDAAYAARTLARAPGFAAAVVGVLTIGIAANTAIFSLVNGVLLRPLPLSDGPRLVRVFHTPPPASFPGIARFSVSPANYFDWKARSRSFDAMALYGFVGATLTGGDHAESVTIARVEPGLFPLVHAKPAMGRVFVAGDDQAGRRPVAITSLAFWRNHFGDAALASQTLLLDGTTYTIVGVMPASFEWPAWSVTGVPIWTPLVMTDAERAVRGEHDYNVIARLKPGISFAQASSDLDAVSDQLAREYPNENTGWGAALVSLEELIVGDVRRPLLILMGAVGFVLLIASANAANLILSRAIDRRKEIAIRTALGASRVRVVGQILAETVLLALVAGVAGAALAHVSLSLFGTFLADQVPRANEVSLDGPVLAFTVGVSLVAGVLAGLAPALRATRAQAQDMLKQGGRTDALGAGRHSRRLLVGAEVALSLMLLAGAGLMLRSISALLHVDPGFDASNLLTVSVDTPAAKYETPAARSAFFDRALEHIRALPEVTSGAFVDSLPLEGGSMQPFTIVGRPRATAADELEMAVRRASPGYLKAMGIPLVRGRDVDPHDLNAVLVSEAAARAFWPDTDPIGQRVAFPFTPGVTWDIVGIVGDVRLMGLDMPQTTATVYQWSRERPWASLQFVARTSGPPTAVAPAVLRVIHDLDPDQAVRRVMTMDDVIAMTTATTRFETLLLAVFAGIALLVAGVGMYSVLAQGVRGRAREIAVRAALGASVRQIIRIVVVDGLTPTMTGLAIGLVGAALLGPLFRSFVFGVGAFDPIAVGSACVLLMVVACLAGVLPAYRAARLDPLAVLRDE